MRLFEPFPRGFREYRWSEGAEDFAVLDALVQYLLHFRPSRIGDDASIAERARSPFRSPLKPSEDFPVGHNCGGALHKIFLWQFFDVPTVFQRTVGIHCAPNLLARISRTPVRV